MPIDDNFRKSILVNALHTFGQSAVPQKPGEVVDRAYELVQLVEQREHVYTLNADLRVVTNGHTMIKEMADRREWRSVGGALVPSIQALMASTNPIMSKLGVIVGNKLQGQSAATIDAEMTMSFLGAFEEARVAILSEIERIKSGTAVQ